MWKFYRALSALFLSAMFVTAPATAAQFQKFGDFVVHYSTINTGFLSAKVAREYGIRRSGNRAMLNVSVQKIGENQQQTAVDAAISVSATNLNGQLRSIPVRAIRDGDAIYYIGEFGISDEEMLDFVVGVQTPDSEEVLTVRFREQFFVRR